MEYGVKIRANSAFENGVTALEQVLRRNRRSHLVACGRHKLCCVRRGDVFQHDAQLQETRYERNQAFLDESVFAIEHIDIITGHFAAQQQRQSRFLHRCKSVIALSQVEHAGIGMRWRQHLRRAIVANKFVMHFGRQQLDSFGELLAQFREIRVLLE